MLLLEVLELVEQLVVLRVRDRRLVEREVAVIVLGDLAHERLDALPRLGLRHRIRPGEVEGRANGAAASVLGGGANTRPR